MLFGEDMKDKNNDEMIPELFIRSKENNEYLLPPKSKADYLKDLNAESSIDQKIASLWAIIEIYRSETVNNGGKYNKESCDEIIKLLQKYGLQIELTKTVVHILIKEGGYCEKLGDYENALRFYESSLPLEIKEPLPKYLRLNNLAFCLNFFKRFGDAEKYLREAVKILPHMYNAWKNLGVSLEHQCQFEEAAECYLKAVLLSKGERRSVEHLKRLIYRCPALRKIPAITDFEESLQE